jgi:hypothetical protein
MKLAFPGFDWEDGNRAKCAKYGASIGEIEAALVSPAIVART